MYEDLLKNAKNVLVFAVGGGNDSVSTLLLQKQFQATFGYNPVSIDIAAMLPDCLDYHNMTTVSPCISIINPNSSRSVQGKQISGFPEVILSANKREILPIDNVYGISMVHGSIGVKNAIEHLLKNKNYDLILAIDVGGDFIAVKENIDVLSPMMDGYMLYALKNINTNIPIIYGIFGLGTDGESTPEMLRAALGKIPNLYEGTFNKNDVEKVIHYYRNAVEPYRYSRTADFTIKEITGENHSNPTEYRGRFHVTTVRNGKSNIYYGTFQHQQDESFYGKYYLFDDISNIENIYSQPCNNGIEWYLRVQNGNTKINHELNGQCYNLENYFGEEFANTTLLFGTPSRKFSEQQQNEIVVDIQLAIKNGVYDFAIIYDHYRSNLSGIILRDIGTKLSLIGLDHSKFDSLYERLSKERRD